MPPLNTEQPNDTPKSL